MKLLLILLALVSCTNEELATSGAPELNTSDNYGPSKSEPVRLGRVYNLNGNDYQLKVIQSYGNYSQVFELSYDNYTERFQLERKLRVDDENRSNQVVSVQESESSFWSVNSTATVYATQEYIEVCRRTKLNDHNLYCDTFEKVY